MQKVLSSAGVASRRAAESLITAGRVRVNGEVVTRLGTLADPERDSILVDGQEVGRATVQQYLVLHKPAGVLTTARDPAGRPTVLEAITGPSEAGLPPPATRVYPVGRLDWDSSGLLILTDDGDLTYRISHPRFHLEKEYVIDVTGHPRAADLQRLRAGIWLAGRRTAAARVEEVGRRPDSTRLLMTLREGRNRQVRRMCELAGFPVLALKRTRIGPLRLGNLPVGCWRYLDANEVRQLRLAAGLPAGDA